MTEEVFIRTEADALTLRIADRLGERQRKMDRMAAWERPTKRLNLRPWVVTMAAAACVAVIFLLTPLWRSASPIDALGIEAPQIEGYRGTMPNVTDINRLITAGNYEEALVKTEQMLRHSDQEVQILDDALTYSDDEGLLYEREAEQEMNAQLRWTYIYLLVQTEHYAEAQHELRKYLKLRACPHRKEAKALLKRLKKIS